MNEIMDRLSRDKNVKTITHDHNLGIISIKREYRYLIIGFINCPPTQT